MSLDRTPDILTDTPEDYVESLIGYLNLNDISIAKLVSKSWCAKFTKMWEKMVQVELGISTELLNQFKVDVLKSVGVTVDFHMVYKHLYRLKRMENKLPEYIRHAYREPRFHLQLLTCCLNDNLYAAKTLPPYEDMLWLPLAFYGDFENVYTDEQAHAAQPGNVEELQWSTESTNEALTACLPIAASRGNEYFLRYYFHTRFPKLINFIESLKTKVAIGDVKAIRQFNYFSRLMQSVGSSGNVSCLRYVHQVVGLPLSREVVGHVFSSSNFLAMDYVREHAPSYFYNMLTADLFTPTPIGQKVLYPWFISFKLYQQIFEGTASQTILPMNGLTVLSGLEILRYPMAHGLNADKIITLLNVLETMLPVVSEQFGLVERHRAKFLLQQITLIDEIVSNEAFLARVVKLGELFVIPDVILDHQLKL